jgi:hypothetical protein
MGVFAAQSLDSGSRDGPANFVPLISCQTWVLTHLQSESNLGPGFESDVARVQMGSSPDLRETGLGLCMAQTMKEEGIF